MQESFDFEMSDFLIYGRCRELVCCWPGAVLVLKIIDG